ncbi:mitochondrial carrier domain-containing protein [Haematococcus lacustris]
MVHMPQPEAASSTCQPECLQEASFGETCIPGSSSASSGPLYEGLGCDDCKDSSQDEVRSLLQIPVAVKVAPPAVRPLSLHENILLGGVSAAIAGTVTFPMDTIKARLMNGQGSTIAGTLRDIVKTQGPTALYRGLPAQLVGIMPEKALKLTLYNSLRRCMMWDGAKVPLTGEALAGAMTACVQVIVTQPYEIVKLRQQTAAGQSLGATIKELGVSGLARGSSATLLRDVPFNALYFSTYAGLKGWIHNHMDAPDQPLISPFGLLAAGLGAGLLAGAVTTPADVIKTRMQADKTGRYKGLLDCINQMWAEGGSAAFLRGLGPRVALIPPMFAITMTCFETFQRAWFPQTVPAPVETNSGHQPSHNTLAAVMRNKLLAAPTLATASKTASFAAAAAPSAPA